MSSFTTPKTWASGDVLTAADMNTYVRDNLNWWLAAWTSYTPTLTNITLGNGTVAGAYRQVGTVVTFRAQFTFGSTSSVSSQGRLSLPVTASAQFQMVDAWAVHGSSFYQLWGEITNAGTLDRILRNGGGTTADTLISGTNPFTWATNDILVVTGTYEAAASAMT